MSDTENKFIEYLRKGDEVDVFNDKDNKKKVIGFYFRALFGDKEGYEGVFVESVYKILEERVEKYTEHSFEFDEIEQLLEKLNEKIESILEENLIHIYQLTKTIDLALEYRYTGKIEKLVKCVDEKLWQPFKKDPDSCCKNEGVSKATYYKLGMRINHVKYIQSILKNKNKKSDNKETHNNDDLRGIKEEYDYCVNSAGIKENLEKKKLKEKLDETSKNIDKPAIPFCNIVRTWIDKSEKREGNNYRLAISHLYDAIEKAWNKDNSNDERYRAKSFIIKTIADVQLRRIANRITEENIIKVEEYVYTLFENIQGKTPDEKEQEALPQIYNDEKEFEVKKRDIVNIFSAYMFVNDKFNSDNIVNEHRCYFFQALAEFCDKPLRNLKEKSCASKLVDNIRDVFLELTDCVYDKYKFGNGNTENYTLFFEAYYCAVIYYAFERKDKAKQALKFAEAISSSSNNVSKEKKEELINKIAKLKNLLGVRNISNLDEILKEQSSDCEKQNEDAIINIVQNPEMIRKLNSQAKYDVLKEIYLKGEGKNANIIKYFVKQENNEQENTVLINSSYFLWLINNLLPELSFNTKYIKEITSFLLNYGSVLEGIFDKNDFKSMVSTMPKDLTLFILKHLKEEKEAIRLIKADDVWNLFTQVILIFHYDFMNYERTICYIQDIAISKEYGKSESDYHEILRLMVDIVINYDDLDLMKELMSSMKNWRNNRVVDRLFFKLYIHYYVRNKDSSKGNTIKEDIRSSKCNPFMAWSFDEAIHNIRYVDDLLYQTIVELNRANIKELEQLAKAGKHGIHKPNIAWSWYHLASFQYKLSQIDDADSSLNKCSEYIRNIEDLFDKNNLRNLNERVSALQEKIDSAKTKAGSRFKNKDASSEWKNVDMEQKRKDHNTDPVYDILTFLRNDYLGKGLTHEIGPVVKSPNDLINRIKDHLLTLLDDPSIPFDFGKALYDYCFNETWICGNDPKDSFGKFTDFNDENFKGNRRSFGDLLSINAPKKLIELLKINKNDRYEKLGLPPSDGIYRTYIPSIRKALNVMEEESINHHNKDAQNIKFYYNVRYEEIGKPDVLLFEFINPTPDVCGDGTFTNLNESIQKKQGGNVEIIKALWGLCDFAVEERYIDGDKKVFNHKDILGHISQSSDNDWPTDDNKNPVGFKYIIRIKSTLTDKSIEGNVNKI